MKQGGLLFPKEPARKKRKKHHKSIIDRDMKKSVLHLRQNRLYRTPSYLWQRKPQILRAIWLNRISLPRMPQDLRDISTPKQRSQDYPAADRSENI